MDKAGAYGIQDDYGAVFVTRIEGCYYNVVGLPLARVHEEMKKLRVKSKREEMKKRSELHRLLSSLLTLHFFTAGGTYDSTDTCTRGESGAGWSRPWCAGGCRCIA